jgi:hypothetical protein
VSVSVFCLLLCLCGPIAGAAAGGSPTASTTTLSPAVSVPADPGPARAINNTTRHRDPERIEERGDLDRIRQRLARRLAQRLRGSALNLSRGQYAAANATLGPKYRTLLGQYAEVAGETDDVDTRSGETFREASREQRRFVGGVEDYQQTLAAYREARRNGDRNGARRLARELFDRTERLNSTGRNLSVAYRTLSNTTEGGSFSNATRTVEAVLTDVAERKRTLRATSFVSTRLAAAAPPRPASFADPVSIRGRLEAANDTAFGNGTAQVRIGNRTRGVQIGPNGSFTAQYRPKLAPAGTHTVTVQYVPDDSSVYLGSEDRVSVTVRQTTPALTVTEATASAAFDTRVSARGRLTVDGRAVSDVPVRLTLDGVALSTARTDANGTYDLAASLPASFEPGSHDLRVTIPLRNRAIARTTRERTLRVDPTDTSLSLAAARLPARDRARAQVRGRLTTADDRPLSNRLVRIRGPDGSVLGTARTNASGGFRTRLSVPTDDALALTATFDGSGTSLSNARARAGIAAQANGVGAGGVGAARDLFVDWWPWSGALAGVLAFGLLLYAARGWRADGASVEASGGTPTAATAGASDGPDPPEADDRNEGARLREQARERFEGGAYEDAVQTAYRAVHRDLMAQGRVDADIGPGATHWTVYRRAVDHLSDEDATALRAVVEAYERAAYAPGGVDADTAEDVLTATDRLVG